MPAYDLAPLMNRLEGHRDEKYAAFNASLVPGVKSAAIGVRVPVMRGVAREIIRSDGWRDFLDASRSHPLYELRMLHAMVLGGARCDISERIALADAFLPHVDNWAVCDTLCADLKPRRGERDALFDFVCACAESDIEFRKRFGYVMLMRHFREAPFIGRVMALYRGFRHEGYYARMGAAWGLATLWLDAREDALAILTENLWDEWTHNKAIQKLLESYRVRDEDKALARTLRRGRGRA